MMRRAAAGLLAAALAFGSAAANPSANPDFTCTLRHKTHDVESLKQLPASIRTLLRGQIGVMADRGEPFNATDVISQPAPANRFIRGGQVGARWFVWYEHGGIAYWKQILIFGSDPSGTPHVIARAIGRGDLCRQTDGLVAGLTQ
jgi:hypothetical protein